MEKNKSYERQDKTCIQISAIFSEKEEAAKTYYIYLNILYILRYLKIYYIYLN